MLNGLLRLTLGDFDISIIRQVPYDGWQQANKRLELLKIFHYIQG